MNFHGFSMVFLFSSPSQPPCCRTVWPCDHAVWQVPVKQSNLTVPVETKNRGNYTHFLVYTRSSVSVFVKGSGSEPRQSDFRWTKPWG